MNLPEALAQVLPHGRRFGVLHVQSEPKQCNSLIVHHERESRFEKPTVTVKIKHFVLIIDEKSSAVLFGIEVYNYLAIGQATRTNRLFVSKIDTSGLIDLKLNINKVVSVVLRTLINEKLTSITYRKKKDADTSSTIKKIKKLLHGTGSQFATVELPEQTETSISLFTKSSNQYFFPNSDKNPYKHLISGDQLLKWWMTLLDAMLNDVDVKFSRKLLVPGALNPAQYLTPRWTLGSIFGDDEIAVYNVPNFPDDPKTRFLEYLIVENRYKIGLKEYYDELGFRQEFRLGNVVGLIGCQSDPYTPTEAAGTATTLGNRKYKRLVNLVKGEDFSDLQDIQILVQTKVPFFLRLVNKEFDYVWVEGKYNHVKTSGAAAVQVNNLTGLIKKKKKPKNA